MQLLTELLRSATPDLARRWLAALLHVPASEREALVHAMEERVLAAFGAGPAASELLGEHATHKPSLSVVYPAIQREGYVEQSIVEYEVHEDAQQAEAERAESERASGKSPAIKPQRKPRRKA